MQTFAWYLLQTNIILLVLGLMYALLLKKETFYQLNRLILGAIITVAFLLPLSPTPHWVASINTNITSLFPIQSHVEVSATTPSKKIEVEPILGIESTNQAENNNGLKKTPETAVSSTISVTPSISTTSEKSIWNSWLWIGIYGSVFIIFMLRFLGRMIALSRVMGNGEQVSSSLIYSKHPISPFSFGSFIVLNPNQYEANMLQQIIQHEQVHVQQWHTLDIIVAEILTIVCWFNPMSWWLSKTIRLNLEYIADAAVLNSGVQRKAYQYNLLKISHPEYKIQLANNFNHSLLKNRIIMMNAKKSPFLKLWKYTLLLPLILMLLLGINVGTAQNNLAANAANNPNIEVYGFNDNKSYRAEDRSIYETENNGSVAESFAENQDNEEPFSSENEETHDGIESDILGDLDDFEAGKENVFVVIRPGLERHDFDVIVRQLEARGISAGFDNQNYNDGQLTQIRFWAKVNHQKFVKETNFEDGQPIVFYISKYKNKTLGMDLGISKEFPAKTQDLLKRVTGIMFVTDDEPQTGEVSHGIYKFKEKGKADIENNIYVVITQNTTEKELYQIVEDLKKEGLFIDIEMIDFNDRGISRIHIKATDNTDFQGNISADFNQNSTDGKVYIYRINGRYGLGHGNQLENNQHIPSNIKRILKHASSSKIGPFREE